MFLFAYYSEFIIVFKNHKVSKSRKIGIEDLKSRNLLIIFIKNICIICTSIKNLKKVQTQYDKTKTFNTFITIISKTFLNKEITQKTKIDR